MKQSFKLLALLAGVASISTAAFADTASGTWKGHLEFSMPNQPGMTPEQKMQMQKGMEMFKKMVFVLTLKADKTYAMKVEGSPMGPKSDQTQGGKWSQKGNAVTLTPNPKKDAKTPDQPVTLTLTGKTMTLVPPGAQGKGKITFVKA